MKKSENLKNKLLDIIKKSSEIDAKIYGAMWDEMHNTLASANKDEDDFLIHLLKAKYAHNSSQEIDNSYIAKRYDEYVFEQHNMARNLGFIEQTPESLLENVKKFINELQPYAELYANISQNQRVSIRNMAEVNDIKNIYEPILAAHTTQDNPKDYEKGNYIADQYERLWTLLKLNKIFDKNEFGKITNELNIALRKGIYNSDEEVKKLFDTKLQNALNKADKTSILDYEAFKSITYQGVEDEDKDFFRYLLARVEKYLRDTKNKALKGRQSDGTQSIHQLCKKNIHQIENATCSDGNTSNTLGGLLLLGAEDKKLISADATYETKLQAYYQSDLIWGQTLCREFYEESNETLGHVREQLPSHIFEQFKPYDKFDKQALEERTKLLYELVKIIWEVE